MMIGWVLYTIVLSICLAAGAHLAERAARDSGRPTRWIWTAAALVALVVPAITLARPVSVIPYIIPAPGDAPWLAQPAGSFIGLYESLSRWDDVIFAALLACSAVIASVFAVAIARLVARRRRWSSETVEGHAVLVSESDGPAVVGFVRSAIVLPRWVVGERKRVRRLILTHELEHQRARDPWFVAVALILVVAQPWNPLAWWIAHRLRLATEVDCDARVLRGETDVRSYGLLLLDVGARTRCGALPGPAFSTPPSSLEQRLRAMTAARRPGRARAGLLLAAAVSLGAVAFLPEPTGLHCVFEDLGFHVTQR